MYRPRLALSVATLALVVPFALTGCVSSKDASSEGSTSNSSQSKTDACSTLQAGLVDTVSELQTQASQLQSDPKTASEGIAKLTEAFDKTASTVTESSIKPLAVDASTKLKAFGKAVSDAATNPENVDADAFTTATNDVQSALQSLATACG